MLAQTSSPQAPRSPEGPPATSSAAPYRSASATGFVSPNGRDSEADLRFSVERETRTTPVLLYVLLEHQSSTDPSMPLRTLNYCLQVSLRWRSRHGSERGLPLIVPLVLYQGREPWQYERDFAAMFADAETRVALVPRFEHPLIDRRTAPAVGAGGSAGKARPDRDDGRVSRPSGGSAGVGDADDGRAVSRRRIRGCRPARGVRLIERDRREGLQEGELKRHREGPYEGELKGGFACAATSSPSRPCQTRFAASIRKRSAANDELEHIRRSQAPLVSGYCWSVMTRQ